MMRKKNLINPLMLMLFAVSLFGQIDADKAKCIEGALPRSAQVQPLKKRKLLVFTLNRKNGVNKKGHPSIPYGNRALELMGEETGAYDVVFSNDTLMFKKENLNAFDAVCFNNTAGVLFEDSELRQNLLDFVAQGKGFMGIHAAAATFVQWPEYGQFPEFGRMLGGYEAGGHPWKPHEWITLKVEEPEHPLNIGFVSPLFEISDEVFQFQMPYDRKQCRVLLSIDTDYTDMSEDRYILPERRADLDLAVSWVKPYGKGRVFYTALGHNDHIYWNAPVLRHLLAGIQYALGDLKVNDSPRAISNP